MPDKKELEFLDPELFVEEPQEAEMTDFSNCTSFLRASQGASLSRQKFKK